MQKFQIISHWDKCWLQRSSNKTRFGLQIPGKGDTLFVIQCHKSNGNNGSLIWVPIIVLWKVATYFLKPFKDTWKNKFRGIETKVICIIECCKLLQVCLENDNVGTLYPSSQGCVLKNWPPICKSYKLSLIEKNEIIQ